MSTSWKKWFALSVLGVALHAVAQVNMRPEVAKFLQAAQEAIQAKQPDMALIKIQEARAAQQLTEPEKMFLERLSVVAAMLKSLMWRLARWTICCRVKSFQRSIVRP
jgi:hypothetical protein